MWCQRVMCQPPHGSLSKCTHRQNGQSFYPNVNAPRLIDGLDVRFKTMEHWVAAEINILFTQLDQLPLQIEPLAVVPRLFGHRIDRLAAAIRTRATGRPLHHARPLHRSFVQGARMLLSHKTGPRRKRRGDCRKQPNKFPSPLLEPFGTRNHCLICRSQEKEHLWFLRATVCSRWYVVLSCGREKSRCRRLYATWLALLTTPVE